ncbi:Lrp/AsnC family transcriptional regulator [Candidatus Woesearchaeota archaeon]|nr:MAG: Lrp/AsnC family transcriptional regulator [Candidatus Woesearchaeota archaeon]
MQEVTAFIMLHTKYGKNKLVYSALKKFPEIKEIYELFGRYDIIIKVEVQDLSELKSFLQNKLWLTDGITHAETLIASEKDKNGIDENSGKEHTEEEEPFLDI